jgi:hypothetical protein
MLHALLVLIGSSGRVVFEKEWVKTIAGVRRTLPSRPNNFAFNFCFQFSYLFDLT